MGQKLYVSLHVLCRQILKPYALKKTFCFIIIICSKQEIKQKNIIINNFWYKIRFFYFPSSRRILQNSEGKSSVNFNNFFLKAFPCANPKSTKMTVKPSISFCAFGIYSRKSCLWKADEIDPRAQSSVWFTTIYLFTMFLQSTKKNSLSWQTFLPSKKF